MSLCLRPVIEKWGESLTYSTREHDIVDVIAALASAARAGEVAQHPYADLRVVWIEKGQAFLNYLGDTEVTDMLAVLADADLLSAEDDERERATEDVRDIKLMVGAWRASVDPEDGSLRFYCDWEREDWI